MKNKETERYDFMPIITSQQDAIRRLLEGYSFELNQTYIATDTKSNIADALIPLNGKAQSMQTYLKECDDVGYEGFSETDEGLSIEAGQSYFQEAQELRDLIKIAHGNKELLPFHCQHQTVSEHEAKQEAQQQNNTYLKRSFRTAGKIVKRAASFLGKHPKAKM